MAQIDASIYQNVGRPAVQLADPMELQGKAMQLKSLVGQQQLQQLQIQQATEEAENQRTLSDLYKTAVKPDGSVDRQALTNQAAQRGLGAKIPGLQKSWAEADKATADVGHVQAQTEASKFKVLKDKLDTASGAINSLLINPNVNNEMVINTLTNLVQQGIMPPEQGAQIARSLPPNPAMLRQFLIQHGLQAMEASKRMEAMIPKLEKVDNGSSVSFVDTNTLTNPQGPAPVTKTMTPGERAADSRSRERLAFDKQQGQNKFIPVEGVGVFVGDPQTGRLTPAVGPDGKPVASVKEPTGEERKAATLYSRLKFSEQQLQTALKDAPGAAKPGMVAETVRRLPMVGEPAANTVNSQERQRVEAAQMDILDAALTLGTGAAYTREQLEGYRKSYFPQIGDDDKTVADKQARLQNVINAAELAAGRAAGRANNMPGPGNIDALGSGGGSQAVPGIDPNAIAAELARRGQK